VQIVPIAKQKEWAKQRKKVFKIKRVEVNDAVAMYVLAVIITTEIWFAARSSKPVRRIIFPWVVFTTMGEI